MSIIVCRPKSLPLDKLETARRRAVEINPDNEIEIQRVVRTPTGRRGGERRIVVVTKRRWPATGVRLSVSFLDNPSTALRARILKHMNAWGRHANVKFTETKGVGEVRIARLDSPDSVSGYWSYVGTEILEIKPHKPTLNLDSFTMRTPESEFIRVVRHEAGHTLGFDHEHMRTEIVKRIDRAKAFVFYDKDQGWTRKEVEEQVLTPLSKRSVMGTTEADPLSIMCYQLPGEIMKDGVPVPGGEDINANDFAFAKSLYPKPDRRRDTVKKDEKAPEEVTQTPKIEVVDRDTKPRESNVTFELVVMDEFRPEDAANRSENSRPKFAQVFASYCGARVTAPMRLRADDGETKTRFGQIIATHKRIQSYTNSKGGTLPDDDKMIEFGTSLFDTLFQGDVRRLYDEARTRERGQLDLILTSMIPWIAEKPWEFAYDKGRASFLATEDTNFIRNVLTRVPADPVERTDGPLRILVASAQPVGYGKLSIEQEESVIKRGFESLVEAGLVEIKPLPRATPSKIHDNVKSGRFDIVHFIGHGKYDEKRGEGCLVFVNEDGSEYTLGERSVREIFCQRNIKLIFLNSCESGRGGQADFNKGIAQSLVAHGLPALVANQYSVLDSSATTFAQHFYWSLAQGMSIGQSSREARIAVNYLLQGEPIDWAVPVVYARDPNERLCDRSEMGGRAPVAGVTRTKYRAKTHPASIAVWDMDEIFPGLDKTITSMSEAQTIFGFDLAKLSVPLGVWNKATDPSTGEKKLYLWAERLAKRLQRIPMELGVEVLVCITRNWLRDNKHFNIFNWWPAGHKPPIIIYSVAGFDEISVEGRDTNRALANAAVAGLAGFYGDLDAHQRGPRTCPLWFNEDRDLDGLVGDLKFDKTCADELKPKLGEKFAALEALLNAFPGKKKKG